MTKRNQMKVPIEPVFVFSVNKEDNDRKKTVHPTETRTSISPSSAVELNTTSALANYATEAGLTPPLTTLKLLRPHMRNSTYEDKLIELHTLYIYPEVSVTDPRGENDRSDPHVDQFWPDMIFPHRECEVLDELPMNPRKINIRLKQEGPIFIDDEEEEFDIYKNRLVEHPTNYTETLFNFVKSLIGTGMLAMANTFSHSGYVLGPLGVIVVILISVHCKHLLVSFAILHQERFNNDQCHSESSYVSVGPSGLFLK
uniref:(California timema) hypothetical protein n=1 Tax=Timema californicum TaxID=61474 RepID=A0A7R9JHW6_TIMCA|nr:unnamed protein product [Timema californicum]